MRGDLGRIHGSVGATIDYPTLILKASRSSNIKSYGFHSERIEQYASKMLDYMGINSGANFKVEKGVPEHSGFGSGTQIALAVGVSLSNLYGFKLSLEEIAVLLGRSKRSGIGTHAFKKGGFLIDAGHKIGNDENVPPLVFRNDIPEDWLFVIGIPEIDTRIKGKKENEAFRKLEPPPSELVAKVSRVVLMQMIPGILEQDIVTFGKSMTSLDYMFGKYWMGIQGGIYSHPEIEACINYLLENDAFGAGQSSWGPALYGLAKGRRMAEALSKGLEEFMESRGSKGDSFVSLPNNKGAEIIVSKM